MKNCDKKFVKSNRICSLIYVKKSTNNNHYSFSVINYKLKNYCLIFKFI